MYTMCNVQIRVRLALVPVTMLKRRCCLNCQVVLVVGISVNSGSKLPVSDGLQGSCLSSVSTTVMDSGSLPIS